jgi:anti-sigma regulatory factor (Ser/Thr protein kinase)
VTDEITLTLPREPEFHRVAHLVLGGLAVRLNLTIENLEDLELALDAVLARTDPKAGDITVRMTPRDGELETLVGPLTTKVLDEIEHDGDDGGSLGLRRVLESTVDDIHVDGAWVRLTKQVTSRG